MYFCKKFTLMRSNKTFLFIFLFWFIPILSMAVDIKVRVLSEYDVKSIDVKIVSGSYMMLCNNVKVFVEDLNPNEAITLTFHDNQIRVEKGIEFIGSYNYIEFIGKKYNNVFSLSSSQIDRKRSFEEDLVLTARNAMLLINRIDLEKYVAGVVQSEVFGSSNDVEFFKIQATVSRTYCLANLNRHLKEGYNLCDAVHCQSYKGRCKNSDILRGTFESFSDVIVDSTNKLISTAYHSNSGGITEDAKNVWQVQVPYLRSIVDTFSIGAKNYQWEKAIPKQQWIKYFVNRYGEKYNTPEIQEIIFNFKQTERIAKWVIDNDTIPTKNIREYFSLRSSFFSVNMANDTVYLRGKGYGHGVGLSQEGAIKMVKLGYSYIDILRFYYNNVNVVKYTEIIDFQ